MDNYETVVMELVVHSGNARNLAIQAIRAARQGDFEKAEEMMQECTKELSEAHNVQTDMIQAELNGEGTAPSLLMVHAQDHLMNAATVRDLAEEMIAMMYQSKENTKEME